MSCLPTCVRAILQWQGDTYSAREISEWCRENASGCAFDDSIEGLIEAGFEVEVIPESDPLTMLEALRRHVQEGTPVVVTLQVEARTEGNHAVVTVGSTPNTFTVMDPLLGTFTDWPTDRFLLAWAYTGFLNLLLLKG